MQKSKFYILTFFLLLTNTAFSQSFLNTRDYSVKRTPSQQKAFSAEIEYPISGGRKDVITNIRAWVCDILDVPHRDFSDANVLLRLAADSFLVNGHGQREVKIERTYEDERCVTFQAWITDKDDETWHSADCASFNKEDGHRITLDEIFNCDEAQIKQLMWQYRGDLKLDVDAPEGLLPVNAGFTDGWVIVIGPAYHRTGAEFKLRYMNILEYLRSDYSGYY